MASRSRRGKLDWVANRFTYGGVVDPVLIGPGDVFGLPLTISDQARALEVRSGAEVGWGAIPEGWGPRTYAVRGQISYAPVIQEVGCTICFRITVQTMDFDTLQAVISTNYDIIDSVPACAVTADEPFAWQKYVHIPNPSGIYVRQTFDVDATCNRRLENNEALYLMIQVPLGSGEVNFWPNLRTLCAVEDR